MLPIEKIISGGQSGVDRAALDAAEQHDLACGGWCPRGRRAEDGRIDERYPLEETPQRNYAQRTEWNVRDSDGTLILCHGTPSGGTAQTIETAKVMQKPLLVVNLDEETDIASIRRWLEQHDIRVLNIAGPRESQVPGIYREALALLNRLLGPS